MKETDTYNEILQIYSNFQKQYYSGKFESIFKALKSISNDENSPHTLEKFVIFYSLPTLRPKIVILGNNPSFFHEPKHEIYDKKTFKTFAEYNLEQVAEQIPQCNSYIDHDHKFAKSIRKIFEDINNFHLLEEIVGFNWFFIQTGGEGLSKLKQLSDKEEFKNLEDLCFNISQEIIMILKPKLVFLFGKEVQKKFNERSFNRSFGVNQTTYVDLIHPSNRDGGWSVTSNDIKTFFHNNEDAYNVI